MTFLLFPDRKIIAGEKMFYWSILAVFGRGFRELSCRGPRWSKRKK
jgi:hypothetical protein